MQAEWPIAPGEKELAAQKLILPTERLKLAMSLETSACLLGSFLRGPEPILVAAPHFRSTGLQDLSLADDFHPVDASIINMAIDNPSKASEKPRSSPHRNVARVRMFGNRADSPLRGGWGEDPPSEPLAGPFASVLGPDASRPGSFACRRAAFRGHMRYPLAPSVSPTPSRRISLRHGDRPLAGPVYQPARTSFS